MPLRRSTSSRDRGSGTGEQLTATNVGAGPTSASLAPGRYRQTGGRYIIGGSGDIAPLASGAGGGGTCRDSGLLGAFAALIVVAILGAGYMTSEYRRGLIGTTFTGHADRLNVLAAKAVVIGTSDLRPGPDRCAVAFDAEPPRPRSNGNALLPISTSTEIRCSSEPLR